MAASLTTASKLSTAKDIAEWMRVQSRPKPPKRLLIVTRPTASDALKEFTMQYNRLLRQRINSRTAYGLYIAVFRAETAKDLISRLNPKIRDSDTVQDALAGLQLSVFAAANWVRRFADDRHRIGEWVMLEEKKAGREMAESLDAQVKELLAKIQEKTQSKTVQQAFQAYDIKWRQEEAAAVNQAEKDNKEHVAQLKKEFAKVEKQDVSKVSEQKKFMLAAYCSELEDSKKELTPEQQEIVSNVKQWLDKKEDENAPAWRTMGIKTLGPFGIAADIKVDMTVEYPDNFKAEKHTGKYIVKGPKDTTAVYEEGLKGEVSGALSPVFQITIKKSDPVTSLIRIPLNAAYFAFAYPVITHDLEVQVEKKTYLDAFLLYGGFVYFDDKMNLIRVNGLWVGCQLQMSAPKPLPSNVAQQLKDAGRFRDITLPQLSAAKAKQFAWVLPGEFPELSIKDGGWAYLYDDESANNYFSIASAESVMGLTKAFSLRDLPTE